MPPGFIFHGRPKSPCCVMQSPLVTCINCMWGSAVREK
jgi:hypothetical protein